MPVPNVLAGALLTVNDGARKSVAISHGHESGNQLSEARRLVVVIGFSTPGMKLRVQAILASSSARLACCECVQFPFGHGEIGPGTSRLLVG